MIYVVSETLESYEMRRRAVVTFFFAVVVALIDSSWFPVMSKKTEGL
jgi:hypothetical protein